jgi:hypothetical protein
MNIENEDRNFKKINSISNKKNKNRLKDFNYEGDDEDASDNNPQTRLVFDQFYRRVLIDQHHLTNKNIYLCLNCFKNFDSNAQDFQTHLLTESHNSSKTCNNNYNKNRLSNLINSDLFIECQESSSSLLICLIDKRVKTEFLNLNSNSLLVSNEEIALRLDELNKKNDEEDKEEEEGKSDELSLLFIDYSIIKFSRIISLIKESHSKFYNQNSSSISSSISTSATLISPVNNPSNTQNTKNSHANSLHHSRNACKKLKCPKCNWHYKYRETLDIHMREKHSGDMNDQTAAAESCVYCTQNLPHPRLGRGEQYKCGYKPYRCDICDYSTTTKGNLSIHMQSDKHVMNVKELKEKNSTQPPTKTTLDSSDLDNSALINKNSSSFSLPLLNENAKKIKNITSSGGVKLAANKSLKIQVSNLNNGVNGKFFFNFFKSSVLSEFKMVKNHSLFCIHQVL